MLICWNTNADTSTNKMAELINRINQAQDKSQMILVTEVKPKNVRYETTEAELDLAGYELHTTEVSSKKSTRGTCIYTLNTLQVTPI